MKSGFRYSPGELPCRAGQRTNGRAGGILSMTREFIRGYPIKAEDAPLTIILHTLQIKKR